MNKRNLKWIVCTFVVCFSCVVSAFAQNGPLKTPAEYGFKASVEPILGGIAYHQETPYNNMCPVLPTTTITGTKDNRGYTGCAATAMCQVLRSFKYPAKGQGRAKYTSTYYIKTTKYTVDIDNDLSAHTYDWDNMLESYGSEYTEQQANAVAQLMFDCGTAAQMQYTNFSSDTKHWLVAQALMKNFGYDKKGLQIWKRANTSREVWERVIFNELSEGRPILIGGLTDLGAGHEYVIDGYNAEGKLHINFGWGGGSYQEFYSHDAGAIYNTGFEILTGIRIPDASYSADDAPTYNVHCYRDMMGNYPQSGQVYCSLVNDGLGVTDGKVRACLAVVRDGKLIGRCPTEETENGAERTKADFGVTLTTLDANSFAYSTTNCEALDAAATYPSLAGVTFNPADFPVQSTTASGVQNGDILVQMLSFDGGKTWEIADGNETKVLSLRVVAATLSDGLYRVYTDKSAASGKLTWTAAEGASKVTTAEYNDTDNAQIFEFKAFGNNGYHVRSYAANRYMCTISNSTVEEKLTQYEDDWNVGTFDVVDAGDGYYTIACGTANANYLFANSLNRLTGWTGDASTGKHLWKIEEAFPAEVTTRTYGIIFDGAPEGSSPKVVYNGKTYTDVLRYAGTAPITADQLSVTGVTDYASRIWVDDFDVHVALTENNFETLSSTPFSLTGAKDFTAYNIQTKDGSYLCVENGTLTLSSTVDAKSDGALWAIIYAQASGDSYYHYEFVNKASQSYLMGASLTSNNITMGSRKKTQSFFYLNPAYEGGYWVIGNGTPDTDAFLQVDGTSLVSLASKDALYGVGGTETEPAIQSNDTYGYDACKFVIVKAGVNVDGIESISATVHDGAIYDLQGRKVIAPVRGQVYLKNGRKFLVK